MRVVLIVWLFLSFASSISAQVLRLHSVHIDPPRMSSEELSHLPRRNHPRFEDASWVGDDAILINEAPLFYVLDLSTGLFSRATEVENVAPSPRGSSGGLRNADAAVVAWVGLATVIGVYRVEDGFQLVDATLQDMPLFDRYEYGFSDRSLTRSRWAYPLLGGYHIEGVVQQRGGVPDVEGQAPLVVTGPNGSQRPLSSDFHTFSGWYQRPGLAVSFSRMQVAVFLTGSTDPVDPKVPDEASLYVFQVHYDGELEAQAVLRSEPRRNASVVAMSDKARTVIVFAADNYERFGDGEDFWYQVETLNGTVAWVHGTDLVIQGENWRDRLSDRGPLLNVEVLVESYSGSDHAGTEVTCAAFRHSSLLLRDHDR